MPRQTSPNHPYPEQGHYPDQGHSTEARIGEAQAVPLSQQGSAQPSYSPVSRRSVLRGVAAVGAVGAAAAVGAGAVIAVDRQSSGQPTLKPVSKPVAMAPMAPTAMAGPLVVYIADTTSGQFDVFGGTGQTRVDNPALVSQLLANLKLA
jgi:hypothetical protein